MTTNEVLKNLSSAQLEKLIEHVVEIEKLAKIGTNTTKTRDLWAEWRPMIDIGMMSVTAFCILRDREKSEQ